MDSLAAYRDKRDLKTVTGAGGRPAPVSRRGPRFVIRQHDATSMHYDLRLEKIDAYEKAGFDEVYVANVGPYYDDFLPAVRHPGVPESAP